MSSIYTAANLSPWIISEEDERKFHKIAYAIIIACVLAGLIVPFIHVPQIERSEAEKLPPRLAKLLVEQKPEPIPEPVPEPEKKEEEKPETKIEEEKPKDKIEEARKKAAKSGLLALSNDLADLRDNSAFDSLNRKTTLLSSGITASQTRSIIASSALKGSGGIRTTHLSSTIDKTQLATRTITQVQTDIDINGDQTDSDASKGPMRTIEDIQLVFDKYKGAVYAIYNRALRKNPTLRGEVVLNISIEPNGKVSACQVISSEINSPEFLNKLVSRVKLFDFGTADVVPMTVTYPIAFMPS